MSAKQGDTVRVHYTGRLEDGSVFDTSLGRDPIEFVLGAGQVIPGFEEAIVGMNPGESKVVKVLAEQAYGLYRPDLVVEIARSEVPPELDLEVGLQLVLRQPEGQLIPVTVAELSESTVTLDANHPLAGQDLTFDIQLLEVV